MVGLREEARDLFSEPYATTSVKDVWSGIIDKGGKRRAGIAAITFLSLFLATHRQTDNLGESNKG